MYSKKFLKFVELWQKDFAIERTIDEGVCLDKDNHPIPWYTYSAIEYLSQFDFHDKTVFEFGAGYSSAFWAERAKYVVSVEDNSVWFSKWRKDFQYSNWNILLRSEGKPYYSAILENDNNYDVIVIDGKCRAECTETAIKRLKKGGLIILDDSDRINTSREYVQAVSNLKKANLLQVDFYGCCPMDNYTKATSIFLDRNFNFACLRDVQPCNGIGNLWGKKRKDRKQFYQENKKL